MSIVAEWLGGPWDGRSDALPDGVHEVSVAVPRTWGVDCLSQEPTPIDYREARCEVVADIVRACWVILWHEPQ